MPFIEIPQPTDQPSLSQADILSNFTNLNLWVEVDHINIGGANQGKHDKVTFPVRAGNPVAAANEAILYTKTSAATGLPELFRTDNASTYSMTEKAGAATGYSRLASGIMIKWGAVNLIAANPKTVTMDVSDVFTTTYAIYCTATSVGGADPGYNVYPVQGSVNLAANTFTVVGFDYTGAAVNNITFSYLVIGQ